MPQTAEQLAADWKWAQERLTSDRYAVKYPLYREYYEGKQNLAFATPKFQNAFGSIFEEFAYNRCGPVVDSISDRLKLLGFSSIVESDSGEQVTVEEGETDQVEVAIRKIWTFNRMDSLQGEVTTESFIAGDAYVISWPEIDPRTGETLPKMYMNVAPLIAIRYDGDTYRKTMAAKAWKTDDGKWRVNLYYPDFIYKFVTPEKKDDLPKDLGTLILYTPDPETLPEGVTPEPNPLANPYEEVPVFHFPNNSRRGAYGNSELRDILPLQDALNKACTDLMVAMEYGAYPQRWAVGLQLGAPNPATGKINNPFKAGPGETWTANQGATFGEFGTTPLEQFITVQDSFDKKISNVARIPSYWLNMGSGEAPSGESLKTAEAPFIAKLSDKQTDKGQDWEDVYLFNLKVLGIVDANITPNWKSPEIRSEQDMLDAALKKRQLGWSQEQIWREMGLDSSAIAQMKAENQQALQEQQAAMAAGGGIIPNGGGNTPPNQGQLTSISQRANQSRQQQQKQPA